MKIEKEKTLERKLVAAVKQRGGRCVKIGSQFVRGLPDRMCLLPNGKIVFVEVKETGKSVSAFQRDWGVWLLNNGFSWYVLDRSANIEEILNV